MQKRFLLLLWIAVRMTLMSSFYKIPKAPDLKLLLAPKFGNGETIELVTIQDQVIDKKNARVKMNCNVVSRDALAESTRKYELELQMVRASVWEITEMKPLDQKLWKEKPFKGPDEETIRQALIGQTLKTDDGEIVVKEVKELEVLERDPNYKLFEEGVRVRLTVCDDQMEASGIKEILFIYYEKGWHINVISNKDGDHFTSKIRADRLLDIKPDDLLHGLDQATFEKQDRYRSYSYGLEPNRISNIKIEEFLPSTDSNEAPLSFTFDYATVFGPGQGKATVTYRKTDGRWSFEKQDFNYVSCEQMDLKRTWVGSYTVESGAMGVKVEVYSSDSTGKVEALCEFWPAEGNSQGKAGSFWMEGYIDKHFFFNLRGTSWKEQPPDYIYGDMEGFVDPNDGTMEGNFVFEYQYNYPIKMELVPSS